MPFYSHSAISNVVDPRGVLSTDALMAMARMDVVDLYDQIMACGKASGEKIDALSVVFTLRFKAKQGPPSASISQVV